MVGFNQKSPPNDPEWNSINPNPYDMLDRITDREELKRAIAGVDWLTIQQKQLIQKYQPKKETDIDRNTKFIRKDRLQAVAKLFFGELQSRWTFINFYQLKQLCCQWSQSWGFHLTTRNKYHLCCFYMKPNNKPYESLVSPSKQRNMTSVKTGCNFRIIANSQPGLGNDVKRYKRPVHITSMDLEHGQDCNPGLAELTIAKKNSGSIVGAIDLNKLAVAVRLIASGDCRARQIRSIMEEYIPESATLTPIDIANIRLRALKIHFSNSSITETDAKRIVACKPLDANDSMLVEDNQLTRQKIREFVRQIMQESREGFKSQLPLAKMKQHIAGFDYRVMVVGEDEAEALVWVVDSMRNNWIRYGDTIFLDAMKRKQNNLDWPYIGPCAIDHANRAVRLCECLCLEEELCYYSFALKSLADMEPRRKLDLVRIMWGDGFMQESLLLSLGLSRPKRHDEMGTDLLLDSHHLTSDVWPKGLGQHHYNLVKDDMNNMLFATSRQAYDKACQSIAIKLASHPIKLDYVRDYYKTPERFAAYYIAMIPGNRKKTSSQIAEVNHSSIIAHVGMGSSQDMPKHIGLLLQRESRVVTKHAEEDERHRLTSKGASKQTTNPHEAEALCTLSAYHHEHCWKRLSAEAHHYSCSIQTNGSAILHRFGTPIESSRTIEAGKRCNCIERVAWQGMCHHEIKKHDGAFIKCMFSERLFQPHMMSPLPLSVAPPIEVQPAGDSNESAEFPADAVQHEAKRPAGGSAASELVHTEKKRKTGTSMEDFRRNYQELVSHATGGSSKPRDVIHGALCSLVDVCREYQLGSSKAMAATIVNSTRTALGFLPPSVSNQPINQRPSAIKPKPGGHRALLAGRPSQRRLVGKVMEQNGGHRAANSTKRKKSMCSFCQRDDGHSITSCSAIRQVGTRLVGDSLAAFMNNELGISNASLNPQKLSEVNDVSPILQSLPKGTKWLVIHGIYSTVQGGLRPATSEGDVLVELSCYGDFGLVLSNELNLPKKANRLALYGIVRSWIGKMGRTSKVIKALNFARAYCYPQQFGFNSDLAHAQKMRKYDLSCSKFQHRACHVPVPSSIRLNWVALELGPI